MQTTTLREINPDNTLLVHITTEYEGKRYYVGTNETFPEAEKIALQYKNKYHEASFFLSDKNDSTIIHGAWNEFENAYHDVGYV